MRRNQKAEATPPRRKLRREVLQWLKDGQQEILERVKARGGSFFTETSSMYFEPPCTERYARRCGRTASQLMTSLLPDPTWRPMRFAHTADRRLAMCRGHIARDGNTYM